MAPPTTDLRLPNRPVTPAVLGDDNLTLVAGGAKMAGYRGDAVVAVNQVEHQRRTRFGVRAVTDLRLLDQLMAYPLAIPVPADDVDSPELTGRAGLVEVRGDRVTRLLDHVVTVQAALVSGRGWRAQLRTAAAFEGVAQRIVILDREPRDLASRLWEADLLGIGVWFRTTDGKLREALAPEVFVPSFIKPARWRFEENAYAAYLAQHPDTPPSGGVSATSQRELSRVASDHRVRTAAAKSDRRQESLPFD